MSWDEDEGAWGDDPSSEEDCFVPCPICLEPVYEEAQRCPHCDNYIVASDSLASRRPMWFYLAFVLAGLVVTLWIVGGFW
ncbi:MAG: hypothetical protein KatS3mg111_1023 [Pirellulaceae bacterium]|nr:MAG: hypothetical protein KatS3mg111_1023 [Pirellulaceae bacterium]